MSKSCDHSEEFTHWEDHSKPIHCCQCEIERLRAHLAACRELLVAALKAAGGGE